MKTNMHYGALPGIFAYAQQLRKKMTPAEQLIWNHLKNNYPEHHFRRQHPADIYVVDFYSHYLKLVIEIDGLIHTDPLNHKKDQEREEKLKGFGLSVLRLANDQIFCDFQKVSDIIHEQILKSRSSRFSLG